MARYGDLRSCSPLPGLSRGRPAYGSVCAATPKSCWYGRCPGIRDLKGFWQSAARLFGGLS